MKPNTKSVEIENKFALTVADYSTFDETKSTIAALTDNPQVSLSTIYLAVQRYVSTVVLRAPESRAQTDLISYLSSKVHSVLGPSSANILRVDR